MLHQQFTDLSRAGEGPLGRSGSSQLAADALPQQELH
jgi:hypothetical protein